MTTKPILDDLEAVRAVVNALEGFEAADQERILCWTREKLGLPSTSNGGGSTNDATLPKPPILETQTRTSTHSTDIKTFVTTKNPRSDRQFAATVAYSYKFEAAEAERKPSIGSTDLQESCRKVGRERLKESQPDFY